MSEMGLDGGKRVCLRCAKKEIYLHELGWVDSDATKEIKKSFEF
jgi:hypothetical protein